MDTTAHSFKFSGGDYRRHVIFKEDSLVTIFLNPRKKSKFNELLRNTENYLPETAKEELFLDRMKQFYAGIAGQYRSPKVQNLKDENSRLFNALEAKYFETSWIGNVVSLVLATHHYYSQVSNAFISSPSNCQLLISEYTDTILDTVFTDVLKIWETSEKLETKYKTPNELTYKILDWYYETICQIKNRCLIQFHITEELYHDYFGGYLNYLKKGTSTLQVEFIQGPVRTNESEQYFCLIKSLDVCGEDDNDEEDDF